jgi:group I intron endonuclease
MPIIYRIKSKKGTNCYVGSTIGLRHRISVHKNGYKKYKEQPDRYYCGSYDLFDEYGIEECEFEVLEEVEEERRIEREQWWISNLQDCINRRQRIATTENEDKERTKQWWKDNLGRYNDKARERNNTLYTCECGMELKKGNKTRHIRSGHTKK